MSTSLYPLERALGVGGLVLRFGLHVLKEVNISFPCGESNREKCVFVMADSIQYSSDKWKNI
jgi:hypothetical protein